MQLTTYKTEATDDATAVRRIIIGMREAGWTAMLRSDEEDIYELPVDISAEQLAERLMDTDQAILSWAKGEHEGTMLFVFGNCPSEVLADCSTFEEWDADLAAVEEAINLEGV